MSEEKRATHEEELEESQNVENEVEEKSHKKKEDKSCKKEESKLEELGQKLAEINDKYLRLSAEFDNYRKRTLKEKMELTKSAGEQILTIYCILQKCIPIRKYSNWNRTIGLRKLLSVLPTV